MLKNFLVGALLAIPAVCSAVQAYRNPQIFIQPDGSQITLSQRGDEFFHYYLTDDGQMVVANDGGFYFAQPDASGRPVASAIRATDKSNRTAQQAQFLEGIDFNAMVTKGANVANARRSQRQAVRKPQFRASAAQSSSVWPSGIGLFPGSSYPVCGSPKALIILVQYKDTKFTYSNAKDYFTNLITQPGFSQSGAHGSALDYFTSASNGKFTPDFDVLGPVTLSNNMAYYGANDSYGDDVRPAHMIRDAIQLLDSSTDFSVYDTDGDGFIDNVYCIYAGQGEAAGGSVNTIWPHSWDIREAGLSLKVDGKYVASYACSAEYLTSSLVDGIGTFCHEFSHVMGLPDLYTTDYSQYETLTPGSYSLMDYGSYSDDSRTPPTYSIYERNAMGWADVEVLTPGEAQKVSLEHILTSNKGYAIATDKTNEFFLLENRQKKDWDAYLPGHGMLIWHIDYNESIWEENCPNNTSHQYVDIVEAGGSANNENASTMAKYPFPGTANKTSFTSSTSPALKSWSGKAIDAPLTNIKETAAGLITFDVCGGEKIDKPVCNVTSSVVESDEPVTVTLTLPATAKDADQIRYIYMYNDESDIVEGTYATPLTISKSCEFEYWTQRGNLESEVTNIRIYIGEEAPKVSTFKIVFRDNSSDSNAALNTSTKLYASEVEEGIEIATSNTTDTKNVYPGTYGLKFSSSKNNGKLVLNLTEDYQLPVVKVVVNAKQYGNDASFLSVNDSEAQGITSADDYAFTLDGKELKTLTLTATKRIYVKSITFYAEGATNTDPVNPDPVNPDPVNPDPVDPDDPTESYSHIIVFDDGGNEGTAITASNFGARCLEGDDIVTITETPTRVYYGASGIKFGSSKGGGVLTLNIASDYQKPYNSVVVNACAYSGDDAELAVNGTTLAINSDFQDYKFVVAPAAANGRANVAITLTKLKLSSTNRLYVKSIDLRYDSTTTKVTELDADAQNAEPVYYNMQGVRVTNPGGGIFIEVKGNKTRKVIL